MILSSRKVEEINQRVKNRTRYHIYTPERMIFQEKFKDWGRKSSQTSDILQMNTRVLSNQFWCPVDSTKNSIF